MTGDWVKRKIGLFGRVTTGKTPSTFDQANFGGPYPFITIPDLDGRVFIDRTKRTLSERAAIGMQGCLLPSGAVMMSCIATVGKCGITAKPSFTNQQINSVIPDNKIIDSRFLYYVFTQLSHELESAGGGGSVYTNVSKSRFSDIEISFPKDISEQRAITNILGTLDDKIDLNRRMNETLEAMARALFKSWFVDFDPVRAKAEGRWKRGQSLPGLPAHLYDLFPDRLVDSELGEIPGGWEVKLLGDLVETVKGRSYKSEELVESVTALVTLKSFARGGGYRPDGLKPFVGTYKTEQVVRPGEVVIACTDVTQAAEIIGRPAIVRGTSRYSTLVASLDTLIVRPRQSKLTRAFIYYLGGTETFVAHTYAHTTGTTVLHMSKEAVPSFLFTLPPQQLVEQFDSLASAALGRIQALQEQSDTLATLRNVLLPKLISGELRVKDTEKNIGGVV
ncbi:MAG: restriction endonuclease subunit S [Candidatus Omnitrophica bacterium]|nr:restriction endonuclease subunit S [Candidatus Omnitrophota bacterium]